MSKPRPKKGEEAAAKYIGQRFGRWLCVGVQHAHLKWQLKVRCDCGVERVKTQYILRSGLTKSCRCYANDLSRTRKTHGGHDRPEYNIWSTMRGRCNNPNDSNYLRYGARGIKVCERWQNSFANFFADMGARPGNLSLDRKDNELGYSPDNCRWSTRVVQNNNRRDNVFKEYRGEKKTISQWAKELNFNRDRLAWHVHRKPKPISIAEFVERFGSYADQLKA